MALLKQGLPAEAREWKVALPPRDGDRKDRVKQFVVSFAYQRESTGMRRSHKHPILAGRNSS